MTPTSGEPVPEPNQRRSPDGRFTLEYCVPDVPLGLSWGRRSGKTEMVTIEPRQQAMAHCESWEDGEPLTLGLYLEYADWFREQKGIAVQDRRLERLADREQLKPFAGGQHHPLVDAGVPEIRQQGLRIGLDSEESVPQSRRRGLVVEPDHQKRDGRG